MTSVKIKALFAVVLLTLSQLTLAQSETAATIPSSFVGTYTLTYDAINSGGPYSQGESVTLIVKSDNSLCIAGVSIGNPVFRNGNTAEAIWASQSASLELAMSNLQGSFNEINVGGLGGSPFYGQLSGSKTSDSTSCSAAGGGSTPAVTSEMESIFSLAESKLSEYFPPGAVTAFLDNYVYRYYASTGVYLAFADGNVYLLGGAFGDAIVNAGSQSSVATVLTNYSPVSANLGDWDLTISGSVNTGFGSVAFSGISLTDVPAPDVNDFDAIEDEIASTLDGVVASFSSVSVTVVNDTSSRRTFDVQFSATVTSSGVNLSYTYNLRYDYTK